MTLEADSRDAQEASSVLGEEPIHLSSCYQVLVGTDCQISEDFVDPLRTDYLGAEVVRQKFCEELNKAITETTSEGTPDEASPRIVWKQKYLLMKVPGVHFVVKLDFTCCIRCTDQKTGKSIQLVPSRHNTWKPANSDLEKLSSPEGETMAQTLRLFKIIRDITHVDDFLSEDKMIPGLQDPCFVLRQQGDKCVLDIETSSRLSDFYSLMTWLPSDKESPAIPSYCIMGTVVKVHSEEPNSSTYPLCKLLLTSFSNFSFIDPHGVDLSHLPSKATKALELCKKCEKTVAAFDELPRDSNTDRRPPWYLLDNNEPIYSQDLTPNNSFRLPDSPDLVGGCQVNVFQMSTEDFVHRIQPGLRRLQEKKVKPNSGEETDTNTSVYLAVLKLESTAREVLFNKVLWPEDKPVGDSVEALIQNHVKSFPHGLPQKDVVQIEFGDFKIM